MKRALIVAVITGVFVAPIGIWQPVVSAAPTVAVPAPRTPSGVTHQLGLCGV